MNYVTENISPLKASEYLKTSTGNRPISKTTVRSYADTMKRGDWMMNGVPIVFDINGHLIDGHHRLEAIILAGISVKMEVCRGVSPDAFTTFDCGRHRSLGQLLAMQNVKNYNTVGSIVAANETLVRTGRIWANNNSCANGEKRTNAQNYEIYSRDPMGYRQAAEDAVRISQVARVLAGSWIGGLVYYLTHTGGYDRNFVLRFFEGVCSLDESEINPANILRKRILKEKLGNVSLKPQQLFAFIVIAWNAYVKGETLKILRFLPENEAYPKLILNC